MTAVFGWSMFWQLRWLVFVAGLGVLAVLPLAAKGQTFENIGGSQQRTPGNTSNLYPQQRPPGASLSAALPPAYADPRFIIRESPGSARTEKLDTSIADGFIYVNSAYYMMGGGQGESSVQTPGHRVSVPSFWISPYEVYWKLWNDVLRWAIGHGYRFAYPGKARQTSPLTGLDNPVYNVSWFDAIIWCNAYSEVRGLAPVYRYNSTVSNYVARSSVNLRVLRNIYVNYKANGYRLPTEAEWELAARGGVAGRGYLFSGSNRELDVAWYRDNTFGKWYAQPVGLLRPNELGLYDMNGNLAEWTADWFGPDYYYSSPVENPLGPGSGKYRVVRGGSFRSRPRQDFFTRNGRRIRKGQGWLSIELRQRLEPEQRRNWVGFRPARTATFRPLDYAQQPNPNDAGNNGNTGGTGLGDASVTDASPYIYSLDPNYQPQSSPYRAGRAGQAGRAGRAGSEDGG